MMTIQLAQYSVTLFLALVMLMRWSLHRHRLERTFRAAVSVALSPDWHVHVPNGRPRSAQRLVVSASCPLAA